MTLRMYQCFSGKTCDRGIGSFDHMLSEMVDNFCITEVRF